LLEDIKRRYEKLNKKVEVEDDPMKYFPKGKRVIVEGKFVAWFADLPEACSC
jgi:hypothetical protein